MSPEIIAFLLLVIFTIGYFYWQYLFRKGLGHIRLGQYQEAVRQYDDLLRFAPRHSNALNNRGYAKACLDQNNEALKDYQRAIHLNPFNTHAVLNLASLHLKLKQQDQALALLDEYLKRDPDDLNGCYGRAYIYYESDQFEGSLADLNHAISLIPEPEISAAPKPKSTRKMHPLDEMTIDESGNRGQLSRCLQLRSVVFYKMGDLAAAIGDCNHILEFDPDNKYALYNRGFFVFLQGKTDQVLEDYNRAIGLDPDFAYPYGGRGKYYFVTGDYPAALENFTRAAELEKKEFYALAGQAITLHAMGQTQAAQDLWCSLLDKDERHRDPAWVAREYGWTEPLLQEADKLLAGL